jgi:proteasome accessory factor A
MVPHFVSRQIITGAGKVGYETDVLSDLRPRFQISQRAEFFEEIVGLETTLKRPIVNSRDEPHADPDRFRRLHVINGDASMSQVATLVKIGSTALLLGALESFGVGAFPTSPRFPVHAIRHYSCDLSLKSPVEDMDGRLLTAWDYQDQLWQLAARFHDSGASDSVASPDEVVLILRHWRELLDGVRDAPDTVSDRIDWLAKKRLVDGYQERFATVDTDPRLKVIDVQYHDVRPEKSLSRRAGLFALFPAEDVATAVTIAPTTTRAYARGECVRRFGSSVVAANWDSLVLEDSRGLLHRIPMLNPLQGTRELAGQYFAGDPSVDEFVQRVEKGL